MEILGLYFQILILMFHLIFGIIIALGSTSFTKYYFWVGEFVALFCFYTAYRWAEYQASRSDFLKLKNKETGS